MKFLDNYCCNILIALKNPEMESIGNSNVSYRRANELGHCIQEGRAFFAVAPVQLPLTAPVGSS